MTKKLLITGGNGMLGSMLSNVAKMNDYEVYALGRDEMDISSKDLIFNAIQKHQPDVIINCAAYTNVELAEDEIEKSNLINGEAPGWIAKEAKSRNILFIHISTDYVFDGSGTGEFNEDDDPGFNQPNQYGKSKRLGEIKVFENNPDAYIVRTQWVFGPNGKNFVDTIFNVASSGKELSVVDDEYGIPTYTKDISNQILYIIENHEHVKPGFYHAVNEGMCNRFEQATLICSLISEKIVIKPTNNYQRKAKVAKRIILINNKLPKLQTWQQAMLEYLKTKNL